MNRFLTTLVLTFVTSTVANAGGHTEASAFGFALIVPASEVQRVERLLDSHREFMESTHSVSGSEETRLNSYTVLKGAEMQNPADPSQGTTGRTVYILTEHYETPIGLQKHMEASAKWADMAEMNEVISQFNVGIILPGSVYSKMNR